MTMKIYINAIPPEGMDIEDEIKPEQLGLETEFIHYLDPVKVKAHIEKEKDIITVDCDIRVRKAEECSKCLLEAESVVEKKENFIYKVGGEHSIDLDDNIKDVIILDYPIRTLCKPDCKGLCPHCGENLNEGPCGCNKDT